MLIMQCRTEIYDSCESSPYNLKVLEQDSKPVYSNSTAQLFSHCGTQLPSRVCFRECVQGMVRYKGGEELPCWRGQEALLRGGGQTP